MVDGAEPLSDRSIAPRKKSYRSLCLTYEITLTHKEFAYASNIFHSLKKAFELVKTRLATARTGLQEYGNISAPTVLFVLKKSMERGLRDKSLLGALGPGFSAGFTVLER